MQLDVALVEARNDVGDGTSKANTAILHTGFDAKPGTLESRLVRRGYELLSQYAPRDRASRSSAPARCWSPGPRTSAIALPALRDKAVGNGYHRCAVVDRRRGVPAGAELWPRVRWAG